ncbi:hypothetical protein CsatA_010497 [Cannabis sativa]
MLVSKPWLLLDYVLIPVNVASLAHFIVIIFDIKNRCLKVCNSLSVGKFKNLNNFVKTFAVMIPILLAQVGFYGRRKDIDMSKGLFRGKREYDPLDIFIVQGLPQQTHSDCSDSLAVAISCKL